MWLLLELAGRNATRNVQRTLLTALTVVFGTALLTVALTWENGIFGQLKGIASAASGHVRVVDNEYAAREDLLPLYENIADVDPVLEKVRAHPDVVAAYPRITAGVTITAGDEIGDVFALAVGAPVGWYQDWLNIDDVVVAGHFMQEPDDVLLGQALAERLDVEIGSEVVMIGQTQDGAMSPLKGTVVGIIAGGNALIDQQAYLSLEKLQWMTAIEGGATEILVYGQDLEGAAELRDAVAPVAAGFAVQAWSDREPWSGLLAIVDVVEAVLSGIIVFITALGVWNTMMMSVLERTSEVGVMRAMGLSRAGAVFLFVVEASAIATLGGGLGIVFGGMGGYLLETRGISLGEQVVQNVSLPISTRMYGDLTGEILVTAFLLGLLMALVGSAPPALRAASIQPVVAMRARR